MLIIRAAGQVWNYQEKVKIVVAGCRLLFFGATVLLNFQKLARSLWERACPRTRAKPVPATA
ncbi:hypothetical protein, partial [Pseudomonas sp. P15-2025]|uniref:hypothetical protein n=1 Tax=Pseudomonas sp. P15-2025 TaxID=3421170 RepID=UPI003FA1EE2D